MPSVPIRPVVYLTIAPLTIVLPAVRRAPVPPFRPPRPERRFRHGIGALPTQAMPGWKRRQRS